MVTSPNTSIFVRTKSSCGIVISGRTGRPRDGRWQMAAKRKYERAFEGKDNAGLRKMIRDAVAGHRCAAANAAAVRSISGVVALTAQGKATLEQVAQDYGSVAFDNATSGWRPGCDCDSCYQCAVASASIPRFTAC